MTSTETNHARSRDQWLELARCTVRTSADIHEAIADECVATERRGEFPSIWHAASVVIHGPDAKGCRCFRCEQARAC